MPYIKSGTVGHHVVNWPEGTFTFRITMRHNGFEVRCALKGGWMEKSRQARFAVDPRKHLPIDYPNPLTWANIRVFSCVVPGEPVNRRATADESYCVATLFRSWTPSCYL